MSSIQKAKCTCTGECLCCATDTHDEGRAIKIEVKSPQDEEKSNINAIEANTKLTITIDVPKLLSPHAFACQKHTEHVSSNQNLQTTTFARLEGGSFSTAAQLPFRATSPDPGEHKFIAFENPFPSPPEIIAGLNVVDCDHRKNLRIRIFADNIKTSSFKLNATTWSESIAYNIGCDWLAVHNPGDGSDIGVHISTGVYKTAEDPACIEPIKNFVHPVRFQNSYHSTPTVVAWICGVDVSRDHYTRLYVTAADVTSHGFNIHIYSWLDTTVHGVTVSWIAYPPGLPGIESGDFGDVGGGYTGWQCHRLPIATFQRVGLTASISGQVQFKKFWNLARPPRKVLMAFTMLDLPNENDFRLKMSSEAVTKDGMIWRARSWGGSKFWGFSGAYIALA